MLDTILTVAGSIAGILASTAIPIMVAWITHRERKRQREEASIAAAPSFGISLSPDAERADRATDRLITSLEASRDRETARADRADERADAAERREALLLAERERLLAELNRLHSQKDAS